MLCQFMLVFLLAGTEVAAFSQPADPNRSVHHDQLLTCREGLVDPQARPEDRSRWAEMLLSYNTPEAQTMIVELLKDSRLPKVQNALCVVIAQQAREHPDRLHAEFVSPLLELFGAENESLRTAAAKALADFPGGDVPNKLGALAARADLPLPNRLAAIDALTPNTHRREVVQQLIGLLDAGVPQITERVIAALELITPQPLGNDPDRWRTWWERHSRLSEETWLADQLRIYRNRSRRIGDELKSFREATQKTEAQHTAGIARFQRELYRTVSEEQRDDKLIEWLGDPLPVVQQTALELIKTRIADEGHRPEGAVRQALLTLLREGQPILQQETLEIVQTLSDASVIKAVLALLDEKQDPVTRGAIFKALGRLDSVEAVPALIREIASPTSRPESVREAAIALGKVAGKVKDHAALADSIDALKHQYRRVTDEDVATRAALLTAMAGVADPAFTADLREAIESDVPNVLRPAIRGLVAVKDHSKMRRLRTLMAHPDPLVRLEAIEAIGGMGGEEADFESLLSRMNPTNESNNRVRNAAFQSFVDLLSQRPVNDRIDAAQRLHDDPALHLKYLETLADSLADANGDTAPYERVLHQLVTILDHNKRYGEAAARLRTLYDLAAGRKPSVRFQLGLQLLRDTLRSGTFTGIATLVRDLATLTGTRGDARQIVQTIRTYLDQETDSHDPAQYRQLRTELQSISPTLFGDEWTALLAQVASRATTDEKGASSPPPPQPQRP